MQSDDKHAPESHIVLKQGNIWGQALGSAVAAIYGFGFVYGVLFLRSSFSLPQNLGFALGALVAFVVCIGGTVHKSSRVTVGPEFLKFQNLWREVVVYWNDVDTFAWERDRLILARQSQILVNIDLHCHAINHWWPKETRDKLVEYAKVRLSEVGAEQCSIYTIKSKTSRS
jgi:hypothetical protein